MMQRLRDKFKEMVGSHLTLAHLLKIILTHLNSPKVDNKSLKNDKQARYVYTAICISNCIIA